MGWAVAPYPCFCATFTNLLAPFKYDESGMGGREHSHAVHHVRELQGNDLDRHRTLGREPRTRPILLRELFQRLVKEAKPKAAKPKARREPQNGAEVLVKN